MRSVPSIRPMRRLAAALALVALVGACGSGEKKAADAPAPKGLSVSSSSFDRNGAIPEKFSCDGAQVNPQLAWSGEPDGTVEFALVVLDPDAPRGTFVHWTVTGIPPTVHEVAEGATPAGGVEHETSKGQPGYAGMCPPSGKAHHYHFVVYALTTKLDLPSDLEASRVVEVVKTAAVAGGEYVGTYKR